MLAILFFHRRKTNKQTKIKIRVNSYANLFLIKVSQTKFGCRSLPLKVFIPYFVAIFVFSGTALSVKFSISSSEISANSLAAIVPRVLRDFVDALVTFNELRDWSKLIEDGCSLVDCGCFLSANRKQLESQSKSLIYNRPR